MIGLHVRDLSLLRGGRTLFAGLDFELRAGEAATLVGPNGAGKTSVLRAVAGLLRPAVGEIAFAGLDSDRARERFTHFLGHQDGLKAGVRTGVELDFWTRWLGGASADAARAISTFDLEDLVDLEVRRLSAGQRRRLGLARLLAAPRPLWLLDEPLAPLDAHWRDRFGALARAHLAGGGLILAAVHDPLPFSAHPIEVGVPSPRPLREREGSGRRLGG